MSGSPDTLDEPPETRREAVRERAFELESIVVQHDEMPDRCTVYPAEATRMERMAEWISADADLCLSLEDAR
ncbi:hypothetical protein DMJ13_00980 [halophilic archaeon]|nr:hypothetical protein DMJ13_00980 [halophilic archaeon]